MGELTAEILQRRRQGIGGSDCPQVFSQGYGGRFALWADKVWGSPHEPSTPFQQRGHDLEEMIAHKAAAKLGISDIEPGGWVDHPEYEWMFSNIDWRKVGGEVLLECKATDLRYAPYDWGQDGDPEGAPLHIDLQARHQAITAGSALVIVAVLFVDTWELRTYPIQPDPDLTEMILAGEYAFWHDHVIPKQAPAVDDPDSAWDALRKLCARPDSVIDLDPDHAHPLVTEYVLSREDRLAAEKREAAAKAEVAALLGDNELGRIGGTEAITFKPKTAGHARSLTINSPYRKEILNVHQS